MRILCFYPDRECQDALTFLLESHAAEVIQSRSVEATISQLQGGLTYHLIVMKDSKAAQPVLEFLENIPEPVPVILITEEDLPLK